MLPILLSLVLAQPAPVIKPAELEHAGALLRDAQAELEPQQYELLQRELGEAEAAFQQLSRFGNAGGRALEVVRGAEAISGAQRVAQLTTRLGSAVARAGPLLVVLAALWPASTATPSQDCPECAARVHLQAALQKVAADSQKVAEEINASSVDAGCGEGVEAVKCTGQLHHAISKRIWKALQDHLVLQGKYQYRDRRFETRAKDRKSHCGYWGWHEHLDDEVIKWLKDHETATPQQFEEYLRALYRRPDLLARFPNGF